MPPRLVGRGQIGVPGQWSDRRRRAVAGPDGAIGPVGAAGACHDGPVTRDSRVSRRIASIAESATLAVDAKAKALKAAGEPVIGFGAGEPDFPTPEHIVEAAIEACRNPANHRYSPTAGLPDLRRAIADKTARDSGYGVDPEPGARHQRRQARGLQHLPDAARPRRRGPAARAVLDHLSRGDRARRRPGDRAADDRGVRASGSPSTSSRRRARRTRRSLLFVSPSNPTGAVYPPDEVEAIGRWAVEHGIWVVTDEIYEHLTFDDHVFTSMPAARPRARRAVRRAERRGQDLHDDRVAGRLDDRPRGRDQRGHQPAVALDVERRQRRAARRARRGVAATSRRSR